MKTIDFIKLVTKMREAQKAALKSHCSIEYRAARKLEKQVDDIISKIKIEKEETQMPLF